MAASLKEIKREMPATDKVNILMVDDQPAKLLSYEAILNDLGENLIKASSAKEALEQLLKHDVAVVLMDVSMPVMDGFELADMIRQHPRFQSTAIIFISAVHLTDLDRLKGYQRGAVDYISVPVVPELLRAKVSVFAELHRKTQQLSALNRGLEQRVNERTEELAAKATALQHLNQELARKHLELDAVVKTAPDIIFSSRGDGSRDYLSNRFYEYTGADFGGGEGFGWMSYLHPEDARDVQVRWDQATRGEKYEAEYRIRDRDGEYRWFRARAVPIRDTEGNITKWYGSCSDIHDSKLLEHSIRETAERLEKMVDERTTALRHLSSRLMALQDEERRRIARELHDGLGQELIAAKMIIDGILLDSGNPSAQLAGEASALVDRAIQQTRSISHLLHPPLLDEVGLHSAVQWYLDGFTKRSGIETTLEIQPSEFPRLAPELETAAFRIIQEALSNVFRHSAARSCKVSLAQTDSQIAVTVRDDGKGIGIMVSELQPGSIGMGIGGMRQRVKEFGGELRLENANPGTLVEVVIPSRSFNAAEAHVVA
ncbi:MAG TPA: response regulator [Terriglobales bacterium]